MKRRLLSRLARFIMSALCFAVLASGTQAVCGPYKYWNWTLIDTDNVSFPKGFLWGSSTAAQQVEGNCTNNTWSLWERTTYKGKPRVETVAGVTCDHWNRYKEDIALMKEMGLTVYRFSVEWSKIEPREGVFDEAALDHYADVCAELVKNGIKPAITLHHYTDPIWFMNKGGFEIHANIPYYVKFCQKVFAKLQQFKPLWFTFNSPSGYIGQGYLKATRPPGVKDVKRAARVLFNVLYAHVEAYQAMKKMPGGAESQIGILHNIFQVKPYHKHNPIVVWERLKCSVADRMQHKCIYEFFKTGQFNLHVPTKVHSKDWPKDKKNPQPNSHPLAPQSLDFVGLNYYSHGVMKGGKIKRVKGETKVDNPRYTVSPEGFYDAIVELSQNLTKPLNIPIYVTENGVSTEDERIREIFFRQYLYAMSQAIRHGHDVRGYMTWSFMDNYSWGTYKRHYGLIPVDRTTLKRGPLKEGAKHYINIVKRFATSS